MTGGIELLLEFSNSNWRKLIKSTDFGLISRYNYPEDLI